MVDLSIVIVNFNSARFLPHLLGSIAAQEWTIDGRPGEYEVLLIDNTSRTDDAAALAEFAGERVHVIQNTVNAGYGQANNQGFALGKGRFHMVLNPDTVFLPGCFQALISVLEERPDADMVGPLAFMDPEARCMMPPNEVPTPELFELQTRGQTDAEAARENLEQRTRFAWRYWQATEPLETDMLSGSCVVFRRELFSDERPFDPGFPLYYEDTDMFLRLVRGGKKLLHVPAARMLHFWSQSADSHARGAWFRHDISARRYYRKHFGEEGVAVYERNRDAAQATRDSGRHIDLFDFVQVSAQSEAPVFEIEDDVPPYFVEFAGNPIFTLAVGMVPDEERRVSVSQVMWDQLGPGQYWIRIVDRSSLETLTAWVITKEAA